MTVYHVPDGLAAMPVRSFLKQMGISTNYWKKVKFSGTFLCNGELISHPALLMVSGGDTISWDLREQTDVLPEHLPLDIRYEDDALLIVNKPWGQLVHPTRREVTGTLANAVLGYYERQGIHAAFHPVHRLDRNTTGLVLIVKQPQFHHQLSPKGKKLFRREYLAIASGIPSPSSGTIVAPIARDPSSIIRRCVSPDGQDAITHYETLQTFRGMSLLRLQLETGRTHQIRVHLSHMGHPLIGDDLYGGTRELIGRQSLHAFRLSLPHPVTGKELVVTAELPPDMVSIFSKILSRPYTPDAVSMV